MKPVSSLMVAAGAIIFFAAGYAKGASSGGANPFIHVPLLSMGPASFVEGPDADPPPWPADAPQASAFPPETRKVPAPSSNIVAVLSTPSAKIPASALYPTSNPPPAETRQEMPSQQLQAQEMREMPPPRRRVAVKKDVTFGITREGRPVTIIWDR
jgi:hypothetical protein